MAKTLLPLLILCGCVAVVRDDTAASLTVASRLSTGPQRSEGTAAVPLETFLGLPVVSAEIAGRTASLLIDTGSQCNLLSPRIAAACELPVIPHGRLSLLGSEKDAYLTSAPELRIGAVTATHVPFLLSPGHLKRHFLGIPLSRIDGVLGIPFLTQYCITLDLGASLVRFERPGSVQPSRVADTHVVPLEILRDGRPAVHVSFRDGRRRLFLLDTGTGRCVVREELATLHGRPLDETVRLLSMGVTAPAALAEFESLRLGALEFTGVRAAVLGSTPRRLISPLSGIIGMGLLGKFVLTLDLERGRLILERNAP